MVDIDIRRIDGTENQPFDEERGIYPGQVEAPLIHIFPRAFEDGFNEPRGGRGENETLPNARDVSNIIAPQGNITGNPLNASDWLWQWGQFLDHDLGLSEGTNILAIQDEDEFTVNDISIDLSPDDILYSEPNFTKILVGRIPAEEGTGTGPDNPREIANEITSFIDGSNGYGSDYFRAAAKRSDLGNSFFGKAPLINEETGEIEFVELAGNVPLPPEGESPYDGKLLVANDPYGTDGVAFEGGRDPNNTSGEILAPYNRAGSPNADPGDRTPDSQEFISGDVRINEQLGLISIHTLFVREHNFIADKVAFHLDAGDDPGLNQAYQQYRDEYVPSLNLEFEPTEEQIRGEFIYEAARDVVIAKNQIITYEEFLPLLIGNEGPGDIQPIDPEILDPTIAVEFSGAAYRLGHTLLSNQIRTIDNNGTGSIALRDAFFTPQRISQQGLDDILLGLNYQQSNDADHRVIDGVRNNLFGPPGNGGQDLVAINLQRGRELGIPGYTAIYNALNPDNPIESFDDLDPIFGEEVANLFEEAYENVEDIDLWLAGLAEIPQNEGALLGPTFSAIIGDQFARLRDGDRFFYTNQIAQEDSLLNVVSNAIGTDIANIRLSDVIANHVSTPELVPENAFIVPFENEVRGTLESDTGNRGVFGTEVADLIDASNGNDQVEAGDGDDIVFGGSGNDTLQGQAGADTLVGGDGSDVLIAEGAGDVLSGGLNNDTYRLTLDQITGGVEIVEEAGPNDVLEIFAGGGGTPVNVTLTNPAPGRIGIKKSERDLLVDINQDGILNPDQDLTITNYFAEDGGFSGGSIENVGGLSREDIIEYTQSEKVTNGPAVYRFFRPEIGVHFYTPDVNERDFIIENLDGFDFEGGSYVGVPEDEDLLTGAKPVYRFLNRDTGVHLYTIAEPERDFIIENLSNYNFEGITYYGYETQQEGTTPLYRFYNSVVDAHFYTPSQGERDFVLENLPDYQLEGVDETGTAYYVQNIPADF